MAVLFEWREDNKDEFAIYDAVCRSYDERRRTFPGSIRCDYASTARYSSATNENANAADDEEHPANSIAEKGSNSARRVVHPSP